VNEKTGWASIDRRHSHVPVVPTHKRPARSRPTYSGRTYPAPLLATSSRTLDGTTSRGTRRGDAGLPGSGPRTSVDGSNTPGAKAARRCEVALPQPAATQAASIATKARVTGEGAVGAAGPAETESDACARTHGGRT